MEKTVRNQRLFIFILFFVIGCGCWVNIVLGRFWIRQTIISLQPAPTPIPPPTVSPTSLFKQVIYEVDTFIDKDGDGVWDENEEVYLVDFPLIIVMSEYDYPIQILTKETPTGTGQIHIVRQYEADQVVEPYSMLPPDYVTPTITLEGIHLCPDKEVKSVRIDIVTTADTNGDAIITIHDVFPLPICPSEEPNL